jgi:elongation factor 1 alpha-like protein
MTTPSKGCTEIPPSLFPVPLPVEVCSFSAAEFFWDTPWGNVAPSRLGEITVVPVLPRGRLLGGSSKPSKLANLAAARKKKQEAAKGDSPAVQTSNVEAETDTAISLLDKLSVRSKDNNSLSPSNVDGAEERERRMGQGRLQYRKRQPSPEKVAIEPEQPHTPEETTPAVEVPNIRTSPSTFASTICGIGSLSTKAPATGVTAVPIPYTELQSAVSGNPFTGPSPDDVVLRAQRKGAVHG